MRKITIEVLIADAERDEFVVDGRDELEEYLQARLDYFPCPEGGEVVTQSVTLVSDVETPWPDFNGPRITDDE